MAEEGYIKFKFDLVKEPIRVAQLEDLNSWRQRLYKLDLIGVLENGVGFGNLSVRLPGSDQFIVSGSGTGKFDSLDESHYSKVVEFDLKRNWLKCVGLTPASSESLSHAAIYSSDKEANAVIHVHCREMWERLLGRVPETGEHAECGTVELAEEIARLFRETDVSDKKIIVTAGHEDGIVTFGRDLDEAGRILLSYFHPKNQ